MPNAEFDWQTELERPITARRAPGDDTTPAGERRAVAPDLRSLGWLGGTISA